LVTNGALARRRLHRAQTEVEAIAMQTLRERMGNLDGSSALTALARRVADGDLDPYAGADELVHTLDHQG